uniref:Uncharacterized protein n=1 Tax=Ditylenchus dipsaci TaxID=166011 RepID=A0A915DAQ8_9BILA
MRKGMAKAKPLKPARAAKIVGVVSLRSNQQQDKLHKMEKKGDFHATEAGTRDKGYCRGREGRKDNQEVSIQANGTPLVRGRGDMVVMQ